jgi:serine/threonine protein kinase
MTVFWQVLASKTKIYIVLEYVTGGELFDKIVSISSSPVIVLFLMFCFCMFSCYFHRILLLFIDNTL